MSVKPQIVLATMALLYFSMVAAAGSDCPAKPQEPPVKGNGLHPNDAIRLSASSPGHGCKKGYCWSYCIGGISWWGVEWCWTSKMGQWAPATKCDSDSDCEPQWRFSNACTVFD